MFDVVVVGAGPSGLQAALSAQRDEGLSVAVVEARDRVGGKTWTVPLSSGRGAADLGAAWVNDSLQPRVWAYVRRFGLDVVRQRLEGKAVMLVSPPPPSSSSSSEGSSSSGGGEGTTREAGKGQEEREREREESGFEFPFGIMPDFSAEEKRNLELVRDHIQAASLRAGESPRPEDDEVSLDQYVRGLGAGPKTLQMVNLWARAMHGVESTQESAAFFIDYCRKNKGLLAVRADDHTGGQHLRIVQGTQAISEGIADLIGRSNIFLSSPVASIDDQKTHVVLKTTSGRAFAARRCILAVPGTMYRGLNIAPPLPAALREVTGSSRMGHYNKAIVCYDAPWWRDLGFNGFFMSYYGPVAIARDTSVDQRRCFALTCFVNGANGEAWDRLHPHQRRKAVLDQIAAAFGGDDAAREQAHKPIEFFEQIWKHEEFSQGALVPVTALGHLTKYASVYGKPVGNIHFVGTEYSPEWKGYIEGALCSGERGAAEVAQALAQQGRARSSAL